MWIVLLLLPFLRRLFGIGIYQKKTRCLPGPFEQLPILYVDKENMRYHKVMAGFEPTHAPTPKTRVCVKNAHVNNGLYRLFAQRCILPNSLLRQSQTDYLLLYPLPISIVFYLRWSSADISSTGKNHVLPRKKLEQTFQVDGVRSR